MKFRWGFSPPVHPSKKKQDHSTIGAAGLQVRSMGVAAVRSRSGARTIQIQEATPDSRNEFIRPIDN